MIKGQTYGSQLFESWAYRLTFDTILNSNNGILDQYGNQMEVTTNNNNIYVGSGLAVIQGGIIENTSSLQLIPQLEANMFYRVVIEIDMTQTNTTTEFNQGSIKLISNSGSYPTLIQQDTIQSQGIYQYEIARFQTNSSAIINLTDVRTYLNYNSLYQELRDAIDEVIQGGVNASQVSFDDTTTQLPVNNVQDAIDGIYTQLSNDMTNLETEIETEVSEALASIGLQLYVQTATIELDRMGDSKATKTANITYQSGFFPLSVGWGENVVTSQYGCTCDSAVITSAGNNSGTIKFFYHGNNSQNIANKSRLTYYVIWAKVR